MTIPVLIAPVINRYDLLLRMLNSVDVNVDALLVVDNGRSGWRFTSIDRDRFDYVAVTEPPATGMGYGGAINYGITQFAEEPWWMWVSNDVEWHPGTLDRVVALMDEATGPRVVTGGFTWGAINAAAVQLVGLIDEWSFFPIYFDDNDYQYRCKLAGVEWVEFWADGTRHGDDEHGASLTILSDKTLREVNHKTFELNKAAYIAKWGGLPREERYTSPWNEGVPIWTVKPDIGARAARRW